MTDKQRDALLLAAMADLRKTTEGYRNNPNGINWRNAMGKLQVLHLDLAPSPVPALGPVIETGSSMLIMSPTHMTSGVGYPAFDTGFGQAGRWIIAWEPITVTKDSSAQGGDAFYARGVSGLVYWAGHMTKAPAVGTKFRKGQRIAQIAAIAASQGGPHFHLGIDARPLISTHLKWGKDGAGPPYTYGAPSIGKQLGDGLEASKSALQKHFAPSHESVPLIGSGSLSRTSTSTQHSHFWSVSVGLQLAFPA